MLLSFVLYTLIRYPWTPSHTSFMPLQSSLRNIPRDAAHRPYETYFDASLYTGQRAVRLHRLAGYKVAYPTKKGGYTGYSHNDGRVITVEELLQRGCTEIEWDGL